MRVRHLLRHHRRNGVLEYQLLLVIGFQNQGILVEALNPSGQFHTAHQINGEDNLVLASVVQETVLNILSRFSLHRSPQKDPFGQAQHR